MPNLPEVVRFTVAAYLKADVKAAQAADFSAYLRLQTTRRAAPFSQLAGQHYQAWRDRVDDVNNANTTLHAWRRATTDPPTNPQRRAAPTANYQIIK